MRVFLAAALASIAAVAGSASAPDARADGYDWSSPEEVATAMEERRAPAIFFFDTAQGPPAVSIAWLFGQGDVIAVLKKLKFVCCRIQAGEQGGGGRRGGRGGRGGGGGGGVSWGDYDGLAKELGVQGATALVVCAFDRKVLSRRTDPVKHDDFLALLARTGPENARRAKITDESTRDLDQVEKWIEAAKLLDATRRLTMVLDRGDQVTRKVMERARDLEARLLEIARERLEAGKRLLDEGKLGEGTAVLEEVAAAFAKYDAGKEAKELLKRAKKA